MKKPETWFRVLQAVSPPGLAALIRYKGRCKKKKWTGRSNLATRLNDLLPCG